MKSKAMLFAIPFILGCAFLIGAFQAASSTQTSIFSEKQPPEVSIKKIPQSPLEIISTKLDGMTNEKPEMELVIKNKTSLPIIAYAIKYDSFGNSFKAGGSILINAPSKHKALQPEEEATHALGFNVSYSEPIKKVDVYVDYVQLANGFVWGPDNSKASETLAGERAGAALFINQINATLSQKGVPAVLSMLNQDESDLSPSPDASIQFIQGFRTGIGIVKDRLKQAYNKNGIEDINRELQKPFDASADRR